MHPHIVSCNGWRTTSTKYKELQRPKQAQLSTSLLASTWSLCIEVGPMTKESIKKQIGHLGLNKINVVFWYDQTKKYKPPIEFKKA